MNIDEIEARANAATPGPWHGAMPACAHEHDDEVCSIEAPDSAVLASCVKREEDLQFILAARTDVPALIARVRELEAELDAFTRSHAILRVIHGALTDALPSTPIPALDSFDVVELVRNIVAERDQALADYQDLGRVMHEECSRLEAECERQSTLAAKTFNSLIANDIAQMRAYGLSYEGVRALLGDFDDGDITFAKLMDLIRAAARAMAEEECAALRALLVDAHQELATIEAITVSPSGVDGLIELVNRIGQKLESSK